MAKKQRQSRSSQVIKNVKKRKRLVGELRDRDGDMCALCGLRLGFIFIHPERAPINNWYRTLDHIVPPKQGGSHDDLTNLRLMHKRCNELRGQRSDIMPHVQTDPWLLYNINI